MSLAPPCRINEFKDVPVPLESDTANRVMISKKERARSRYTVKKDLSFCWKKFLSLKQNEREVKIFPSDHRDFFHSSSGSIYRRVNK